LSQPFSFGDRRFIPIEISYQKSRRVVREDWYGRVMRWIGEHAISTGMLGGLAVVGVAAASAPGGIAAAPLEAGLLSLMVVLAWTALFYLMRDFFARQSFQEVDDRYHLQADAERFELTKNDTTVVAFDAPSYEIYLPPGVSPSDDRPQNATEVWLAVRGEENVYIIETKVTAEEAGQYPRPEGLGEEANDELPIHLSSGLLQLAERAE